MPVEVILPKVDMDMTHGTLAVWHVSEGDAVLKGAPLFDIETDKAAIEVEAPASGKLQHVTAKPGDKIAVGSVVAFIYGDDETVGSAPEVIAEVTPDVAEVSEIPAPPRAEPVVDAPLSDLIRATPAARAAARAAGIPLHQVTGTGPRGRIQCDDVMLLERAEPVAISAPAVWNPQSGPLHVNRRNGRGRPVVLVHGFTADSQSWAPLEKLLPPDTPLVRIDLPGHGRSPHRKVRGFADLARMVIDAFDDATRDVETVHLLGHSLGAAVALALADIRPRRIASLALIAPAGLGPEVDAAALNGIVRASRAESLGPWLRRLTATPEAISDGYVTAAMKARQSVELRAVQADMADTLFPDGVQAFDLRPALNRLTAPAALIWGRQDRIIPHRHALAADGDFAMHLLAGAGHIPQIECPERVALIVARLVRSVEQPAS